MKKQSLAKILVIVLVLCAICAPLASCGGSKTPDQQTTTENADATKEEVTTSNVDEYGRTIVECDVVTQKLNFDAQPVTILATEDRKFETYDEDGIAGDTMNEALYSRNMFVENAVNVELDFRYCAYTSQNRTMMQKIRNSTTGAEDPYDIVLPHAYYSTPLVAENRCSNLLSVPYLDFDKPWWNSTMNEEMSLNNQLYIGIGDFSLSSIRNTFCMFYNKTILRDFNRSLDIYEVVEDGDWTVESFKSIVKDIYTDRDETPGQSAGDLFGFVTSDHAFNADAFLAGFNVKVTNRTEDDKVMIGFGDSLSITAFDVTRELYHLDETFLCGHNGYLDVRKMFSEGQAAFVAEMFCMTDTIGKEMTGYGIIPVPKLNDDQDDYKSTSQEGFSALIIPANIAGDELDRTTATLEALCYASYNRIVPLYFEKILKLRYSPEVEDSRMFDLILNSRYYNFGFVYSNSISNILWTWRTNTVTDVNMARYWNNENGATYDAALAKLLEYFYPEG